jgi:tetratricopeptide (TPR) repeat protein
VIASRGSLLLLAALLTAPGVVSGQRPALEPVPLPGAGAVAEDVARELAAAHRRVEELAAVPSAPAGRLAGAYGALGRLLAAYGHWRPARAALDNAAALEPSAGRRAEWIYLAGYALERQGGLEAAAGRYRRAVEGSPRATAPRVRLALALLELDRTDEAKRLLDALVEDGSSAAIGHFGLGRLAARSGDPRRAARHFERALALQPGAAQVHYPLAQAYRRLGDLERARNHLERHAAAGAEPGRVSFPDPAVEALASAGSGGALHKLRGDELLLAGDAAGAAAAYAQAVEADPTHYWARKSLALTLHQLGRVEEAERELAAALALDPAANGLPGSGVARERSRLHYALGGIAANRGREDDALERFRRAAELDPGYAEPHVQIGNLHGRAGRLERALEAFGRALELDPELAQARLQRATTLMDLGRFAEAIPELERYLASHPDDQRARALLRTVDPPPE